MALHSPITPFPVIEDIGAAPWQWPMPPFMSRHVVPPAAEEAEPCLLEATSGTAIEGELVAFDPAARSVSFRMRRDAPALTLPFQRFRRLTLLRPLAAATRAIGEPALALPMAAEERPYKLLVAGAAEPMLGQTVGHVENELGLFLFTPIDDDRALQRVFVPQGAYQRARFGLSAMDLAAEQWISSPPQLLQALERQRQLKVRPIGQSLLELGMITANQLERALRVVGDPRPLGERLVAQGVISAADLQTALAHKMGYPVVDLTRFAIEPDAVRRLSPRQMRALRALPLMHHQDRLVVAVDRLSRVNRLHQRATAAEHGIEFLPVLASRRHLRLAWETLVANDTWSPVEPMPPSIFKTTL